MNNKTTYQEHLEVGQKILVYWRFEAPNRRWNKARVEEIGDSYVIVAARGAYFSIGPENYGDNLYVEYDKNDDLYLSGPFGLHATRLHDYNGVKSIYRSGVYGGRVFIHPGNVLESEDNE